LYGAALDTILLIFTPSCVFFVFFRYVGSYHQRPTNGPAITSVPTPRGVVHRKLWPCPPHWRGRPFFFARPSLNGLFLAAFLMVPPTHLWAVLCPPVCMSSAPRQYTAHLTIPAFTPVHSPGPPVRCRRVPGSAATLFLVNYIFHVFPNGPLRWAFPTFRHFRPRIQSGPAVGISSFLFFDFFPPFRSPRGKIPLHPFPLLSPPPPRSFKVHCLMYAPPFACSRLCTPVYTSVSFWTVSANCAAGPRSGYT